MSGLKDFLHDKLPHTDTETKVESVPAPVSYTHLTLPTTPYV